MTLYVSLFRFCCVILVSSLFMSACSDGKREKPVRSNVAQTNVVHVASEVAPVDHGKQIQIMMMRLDALKRAYAKGVLDLGKMQADAINNDPELMKMEKEYLAERQVFADKLDAWDGVKECVEKKNGLMKRALVLSEQTRAVIAEIKKNKDDSGIKIMRDKLASLRAEFRDIHDAMGVTGTEISRLRDDVRRNDPGMRKEHLRLQEKHHLLYMGKVNVIPSIVALRNIQNKRQAEIEKLETEMIAFRSIPSGGILKKN